MRTPHLILAFLLLLVSVPSNSTIVCVDHAGGGDYLTIQEGIDAASEGDTVLVARGVYAGPGNTELDFGGTNMVLLSEAGRDSTTIDCELSHRALYLHSGEDTTSVIKGFCVLYAGDYGLVFEDASPVVDDCRIQWPEAWGATVIRSGAIFRNTVFTGLLLKGREDRPIWSKGLRCFYPPGPTLRGCLFEDIDAGHSVYCMESPLVIRDCQFIRCEDGSDYGVVRCEDGPAVLEDVLFHQCWNDGGFAGWADVIGLFNCTSTLTRVTFTECGYDAWGIIYCVGGTAALTDISIWYGASDAGIWAGGTSLTVTNLTIAWSWLTGVSLRGETCSLEMANSIIAYNSWRPIYLRDGASATTYHSCMFGNAGGDSLEGDHYENLFEPPLFCDLHGGNLELHDDSPCLPPNNPWGVLMGAHGAGGCGTGVNDDPGLTSLRLFSPTPTPAGGPVELSYFTPVAGVPVELSIYNVDGSRVWSLTDAPLAAGTHTVVWGGVDRAGEKVASGVYFVEASTGTETARRTLVVVR